MSGPLRNYIPALQYGAKILPQDLAGMVGLPYVGNIYYVDPNSGSDTANSGTSQDDALATVAAAYDKCVSGQHDTIIVAPTGGTGRTTETTAITWAKRFTHLIGSVAPIAQDARAGINFAAGSSLTISQNGCLFKGITLTGTADINVPVTLTGDYNSFIGVDFKGSLNDTTGDDAAARSLVITGADENYFGGCAIGSDTYTRSAANASLEMTGGSARNKFEGCMFPIFADAATPVFFKAGSAADIDRFVWFKDCMFHNAVYSSGTTLTVGMTLHAAVGGTVILDGCSVLGVTDWSSDYTALRGCNMPDITAANAGFMEQLAT